MFLDYFRGLQGGNMLNRMRLEVSTMSSFTLKLEFRLVAVVAIGTTTVVLHRNKY